MICSSNSRSFFLKRYLMSFWTIVTVVGLIAIAIGILKAKKAKVRKQRGETRRHFKRRPGFYHTSFGRALSHAPKELLLYAAWIGLFALIAACFPPYEANMRDCWLAEYFSWYSLLAMGILARVAGLFGEFEKKGNSQLSMLEWISWLAPAIAFGLGFLAAYPVLDSWAPSLYQFDYFHGVQLPGEAMADAWACLIMTGDSVGCGM